MSSMNEAVRFILGNTSSDEYGVGLASSFGSTSRNINAESRSLITTKNAFNNIFNFHGVKYDSPLQFDIIIYNLDGTYIDCNQERSLKKWLLKNKREWFQVDQDDMSDCQFYCIGVSAELLDVGSYSGGMKITFEADSPWAWSGLRKKPYTTVNNTLSFTLNSIVDFDEYIIYPTLIFTCLGVTNISIKNNTTNEIVVINNCSLNEVITLSCSSDKIKSSTGRNLIADWNKVSLGITENTNSFTLAGNFKVEFQYRLPIRIGG